MTNAEAIETLRANYPDACFEQLRAAVDKAIKDLEAQVWIPCSERLPEEYGNYLATMDDGDVQECTYSPEKNTPFMRGGWSTCEADGIVFLDIAEVTAWQPLPEPYQEGEG